ncbi:MAG: universal stress protein [Rhodospirillaceae bacterium]|nr:universal stress protein [Rhodospirillaceae bacterium]
MAFKDILVCLDSHPSTESRIRIAVDLALRFEAHVTGLRIIPLLDLPGYYTPEAMQLAVEMRRREAERYRSGPGAGFEEALRRNGVSGELRVVEAEVDREAALNARYADLVVLGQPDPDRPSEAAPRPDAVVLQSGRPGLVVPYIGAPDTLAERVLVAWNAGREAARAVNDALPLMRGAKVVRVVSINAERTGAPRAAPGAAIGLHLARHGINAEVSAVNTDIDPADMLLSIASDFGAHLVVMGAYGHSRAREMVLGGFTRHMLEHMTVPVFMSH